MNINRLYSKKEVNLITGTSPTQLHKWLELIPSLKIRGKVRKRGRGRPTDMLSLNDIYRISTFKKIIDSGLYREPAEKFLDAIEENNIDALVSFAKDRNIDDMFEKSEALWHFLSIVADIESAEIKGNVIAELKRKAYEVMPEGSLYLIFCRFGKLIESCIPAVDGFNYTKSTESLFVLQSVVNEFRGIDNVFIFNFGKMLGEINYWIRRLFSDDCDEWLDDLIGDEIMDYLLSDGEVNPFGKTNKKK
jgi:hypothetical protein